jgi:hypothetical protein
VYANLLGTIGDADIALLTKLTLLRALDLGNTRITDTGLNGLVPLKRLERLYLMNTRITDVGLSRLKERTALKKLDLRGTRITKEGIDEVCRELPACILVTTDGPFASR